MRIVCSVGVVVVTTKETVVGMNQEGGHYRGQLWLKYKWSILPLLITAKKLALKPRIKNKTLNWGDLGTLLDGILLDFGNSFRGSNDHHNKKTPKPLFLSHLIKFDHTRLHVFFPHLNSSYFLFLHHCASHIVNSISIWCFNHVQKCLETAYLWPECSP